MAESEYARYLANVLAYAMTATAEIERMEHEMAALRIQLDAAEAAVEAYRVEDRTSRTLRDHTTAQMTSEIPMSESYGAQLLAEAMHAGKRREQAVADYDALGRTSDDR